MVYEERVLAFVDIIGFRDMVTKSENNNALQEKISQAMDIIHDYKALNDKGFGGEDAEKAQNGGLRSLGIQVTTFSDSAIISYPLSYDGALFYLILDLIHMQMNLLWLGILMRGAITIGKAHHDTYNAFGPAMVKAYEMENKSAIYPRIILRPEDLKKGLAKSPSFHNEYDLELIEELLNEDYDGFFSVDYLRQNQEFDYPEYTYYEWLCGIREMLIKNLNDNQMNSRVFAKYYWLMEYWNRVLSDDHFSIPVDGDVNESELQKERDRYMNLIIDPREFFCV